MIEAEEKRIIPLKFDLMFKKVFASELDKMPLKELLRCILNIEPKEITILNPEIIGSSYYDKGTIVDLIVEIEDGTKIGIEMNTNVNKYLINRNLFYMFKIASKDRKRGSLYNELNKHIQINIDCEGYHKNSIMRYKMIEEETGEILTDKIEIVRVDLPYFVDKCYNKDVTELDYKDKFIGMIGIEDKKMLQNIIKGEEKMEEIMKKVEDFSDDEEILGAYDAEWHRQEVERVVRLAQIEEAEEEGLARGMEKGMEKGMAKGMAKGIEQGIEQGIVNTAKNMLKENIDIELISKVTGLSIEKIQKII